MKTLLMGVLNCTPDSFSDGGRYDDYQSAIAHGLQMIDQGADLIDIGGESTRPGAQRPSAAEEIARVIPVIESLSSHSVISVDTMRAEVASKAIEAGAQIINDVSGGLADPQMLDLIAQSDVDYICQHWRGFGHEMIHRTGYDNVVDEMISELNQRVEAAINAGIEEERIIIDPGLGFAKEAFHDWEILRQLDRLHTFNMRILIGASRKRFIGALLCRENPCERDAGTAAITAWCQLHGIWAVRTHEICANRDTLDVTAHLMSA